MPATPPASVPLFMTEKSRVSKDNEYSRFLQTLRSRFVGRDPFIATFEQYIEAPSDKRLPVLMLLGNSGCGKTWLQHYLQDNLRHRTAADPIPSARISYALQHPHALSFREDWSEVLLAIRVELGVDCPEFDLAYAMMRIKEGVDKFSHVPGTTIIRNAGAVARFAMNTSVSPTENIFAQFLATNDSFLQNNQLQISKLGQWLLQPSGNQDLLNLIQRSASDIHAELQNRLDLGLRSNLSLRPDKACQTVVFIDNMEALQAEPGDTPAYLQKAQKHIADLAQSFEYILFVLSGSKRLTWHVDTEGIAWKDQPQLRPSRIGDLPKKDAEALIGRETNPRDEWRGTVLRTYQSVVGQKDEPAHYHPYTLALCAAVERVKLQQEKPRFAAPPLFDRLDSEVALVDCFLKQLGIGSAQWVTELALTPRFTKDAAFSCFPKESSRTFESVWHDLTDSCLIEPPTPDGWYSLSRSIQEMFQRRAAANDAQKQAIHTRWHDYFKAHAKTKSDNLASLAWYHQYQNDSETTLAA